jgi:hypothetical protein
MHLAIQRDFTEHFGAIGFQSTIEIMQIHSGESTQNAVEHKRRPTFMPRVMPSLLPSADDIKAAV